MSVAREVQQATGLEQRPNEAEASYVRRLAEAVDKLPDESWSGLTEEAQVWVNSVLEALHLDKPVPPLEGLVTPKKEKKPEATPKKEKKPEATPKKEKKPDTRPIMTTGKLNRDARIRVLAKENPHEEGTRAWWAFSYYEDGMTVREAYNRCVGWTNIVWDQANGYIDLEES